MKNTMKNTVNSLIILLLMSSVFFNKIHAQTTDVITKAHELMDAQKNQAAKILLEKAFKSEHNNSEIPFLLGKICMSEGDFNSAIDWFDEATDLDKKNSEYHYWLGKAYTYEIPNTDYFNKGVFSYKAKNNLEKSIELDENNLDAYYLLGIFLLSAPSIAGGDEDDAWEIAEKLEKKDFFTGHFLKAFYHKKNKNYNLALKEYELIMERFPKNTDVLYEIGIIYQKQKKYDSAFSSFEKAIEIDIMAYNSIYQIGKTAAISNQNLDRGIECLKIYLDHKPAPGLPKLDAAHWRLSSIYKLKGDIELSKKELNKAIELNPEKKFYKTLLESYP